MRCSSCWSRSKPRCTALPASSPSACMLLSSSVSHVGSLVQVPSMERQRACSPLCWHAPSHGCPRKRRSPTFVGLSSDAHRTRATAHTAATNHLHSSSSGPAAGGSCRRRRARCAARSERASKLLPRGACGGERQHCWPTQHHDLAAGAGQHDTGQGGCHLPRHPGDGRRQAAPHEEHLHPREFWHSHRCPRCPQSLWLGQVGTAFLASAGPAPGKVQVLSTSSAAGCVRCGPAPRLGAAAL